MIAQLIEVLQDIGLEPTVEESADILWFASYLDQPDVETGVASGPISPRPAQQKSQAQQEALEESLATKSTAQSKRERSDTYLPSPSRKRGSNSGASGLTFRSPAAKALPGRLEIGRALRPLMRRVPSRTHFVVDEETTVQRTADEGNWTLVFSPALSRWLEVVLVVDESSSMAIWWQTIAELQRLLERLGAFHHVQRWGLTIDPKTHQVRLYAGTGPQAQRNQTRHPRELIAPHGQRLILVVSDCISPAWDNGEIARMLTIWGQNGPLAILQMLPERLWLRTGLGVGVSIKLRARTPAIPNSQLEIELPWHWFDEELPVGLPIPVVTLEPTSLMPWAQSVAGIRRAWIPGVLLPTAPPDKEPALGQEAEPLSAEERIQLFRATASPLAWRLAGYLAAAPLSLPVMRLVQRVMLPNARQVHLAEVFLSGLIKRQTATDQQIHPDDVRYDFVEGVRDLLLSTILVSDTVKVLTKVSNFIDKQTGHPLDFRALLADPTATDRILIEEGSQLFATVAVKVLRRLGGNYARLAKRIESTTKSSASPGTQLSFFGAQSKESQYEDLFSRKSIRSAFKMWLDSERLGQHPLAQLKLVEVLRQRSGYGDSPAGYGLALHKVLLEGIASLKPAEEEPSTLDKEWRPYFTLTQRYLGERNVEYIADRLGIGKRQYYREQNKGFDWLADWLHEQEQKGVVPQKEATFEFQIPSGAQLTSFPAQSKVSRYENLFSRKSIRSALQVWLRSETLGQHPLAQLKLVEAQRWRSGYGDSPAGYGLALHKVLLEGIASLKPAEEEPSTLDREWRPYFILTQRYLGARSQEYVVKRLGIAERTSRREQNEGFYRLADWLREQEQKGAEDKAVFEFQIPFLAPPQPSYALIGREQVVNNLRRRLRRRLFMGGSLALFAINGLPGVGKTVLAITLAHDPQVRAQFSDGVLWVGLGREPDVLSQLMVWGVALGIRAAEMAKFDTIRLRAQMIQAAIGTRKMLLVIDDAWKIEEALAFKLGGPNCAHLLTTRKPDLALDFADEGARVVQELNEPDSLVLLGQFVSQLIASQPEQARALVQAVGGLPLALILIGRYLRNIIRLGQANALPDTLARLQHTEQRLRLTMPQSPLNQQPSLPYGIPLSLLASIELSDSALDEPARQMLRALAVFPPKPNSFPADAAVAVTAQPTAMLQSLTEAGLLESIGNNYYTLHQAIADYARIAPPLFPPILPFEEDALAETEGEDTYYERGVTYFAAFALKHSHTDGYPTLDANWQNVSHFLQRAYQQQQWQPLVTGVQGLTRFNLGLVGFLDARGYWNEAQRLLEQALEGARALNDLQLEASILTKLGAFAFRQADFEVAKEYLQQSLAILEPLPLSEELALQRTHLYEFMSRLEMQHDLDAAYQWVTRGLVELDTLSIETKAVSHQKGYFYVLLSTLQGRTGKFSEGIAAGERGLALLPPEPTAAKISALITLGAIFNLLGQIDKSIEYANQGIELAQALGDSRRLATLWMNFGINQRLKGNLSAAITSYQKALQLYQRMGDAVGECNIHYNIGAIYIVLGEDELALRYLTTAVHLAQRHGLLREEAYAKVNLANLQIYRGELAEATVALSRASQICQQLEQTPLLPLVLRYQAEIARLNGQHEQALTLIEHSLQVARERGRVLSEGIGCSIKGKILDAMRRFDEAEAAHQKSLQILADQDPYDLAESQRAMAEHLIMRDGTVSDSAKSLLTEALATFERLGAKRDIALTRTLLNQS